MTYPFATPTPPCPPHSIKLDTPHQKPYSLTLNPSPKHFPNLISSTVKLPFLLSASALILVTACQTQTEPEKAAPAPAPKTIDSSSTATSTSATPDASGWVTRPSGLRYQVLSSGPATGVSPTLYDSVSVHYRGTLRNGTVFDSSIDRGEPATFGVSQVIPGWTEALRLMKPGDKWMLYIPSHLAYGDRAVGDKITPHSDLIFEVQLLQVAGR